MKKNIIILLVMLIGSLTIPANGQNKSEFGPEKAVHIVLFKFKQEATPQQIQHLGNEILRQKNTVPGLLEISFGEDFTNRAKGFTHAEVAVFKDKKSLEDFNQSDAHLELISKHIKPILEDILVVDYLVKN